MSALGRRSAIWDDNICPLMCEVRGKRWPKYIIIIILENSEVQWSIGSTWNKYISNFKHKIIYEDAVINIMELYLLYNIWVHHMIRVQDHVYYKGGSKPQYTIMMSLQKYGSCVSDHNIILRNLGHRHEPKVFVKNQKNQYNPGHVNRCYWSRTWIGFNKLSTNRW